MRWNKARTLGLNALPLVKGGAQTTLLQHQDLVWHFLKHSTSQGTQQPHRDLVPADLCVYYLGGKAKSIQTQTPQHRGGFKRLAAKLQGTAPLEQEGAGNPEPAGDFSKVFAHPAGGKTTPEKE